MHNLLVSCQRNLRHSIAEMITFTLGKGQGGRQAQFAGVLPEKPETQLFYYRKTYALICN
jgi:hypothetical protein